MKAATQNYLSRAGRGLAIATVLAGAGMAGIGSASSAPLPPFTINPNAVGLKGLGSFTVDNYILNDYATSILTPTGTGTCSTGPAGGSCFSETGTLAVAGFNFKNGSVGGFPLNTNPPVLGLGYGLYFSFTATGYQSTPSFTSATVGVFNSASYSLYGYNTTGAPITYSPDNSTPAGVSSPILLATGSLLSGVVGAAGGFPYAGLDATFKPDTTNSAFFVGPVPFYDKLEATFTNTESEVTFCSASTDPGCSGVPLTGSQTAFIIEGGGGSANYIPEPASLTVMGVGLLGFGLVRVGRRRATA